MNDQHETGVAYRSLWGVREAAGSQSLAFYIDHETPSRTVIRCWRTLDPYITVRYVMPAVGLPETRNE